MHCGIAYGPGRWHDWGGAEVEDVLRDLVVRDELRAEVEGRHLQVVVDDVESRRVDPREIELEGPLRPFERAALLLERAPLAIGGRLDALERAASGIEHDLDGRAAGEGLPQAAGERGLRARKLEDLLPLVEPRFDRALAARLADVGDGEDSGLPGGSHRDSFLGSVTPPTPGRRPPS
jgi:hypothetical protein